MFTSAACVARPLPGKADEEASKRRWEGGEREGRREIIIIIRGKRPERIATDSPLPPHTLGLGVGGWERRLGAGSVLGIAVRK